MASESGRIQVRKNEVLLLKNGQPILRVERGTTLSVIKLLYQADPRNKGTVIGLRPETDEPLPCVLTLDHSPLEEAKYELITHETSSQSSSHPASKEEVVTRAFHDGNSSNLSNSFYSQASIHSSYETSSALPQMAHTNHATPLTVNISPESNPKKSLVYQRESNGSSLLVARSDNDHLPSHLSIFASSRRKKTTSRKSVIPRKVSPSSSPNPILANKSIHRIPFQREKGTNLRDEQLGDKRARFGEHGDSPGLCDSTENGNPTLHMEEADNMDLSAAQHRENGGSAAAASYSVEDATGISNFPNLESSSTNGSSPAVSDDHPVIIDVHSDSRETSGGENDSDSNFVSLENSPSHNHPSIAQGSRGNIKEVLPRANEEAHSSHTLPVVLLQSTVLVKTEPNEFLPTTDSHSSEQNNRIHLLHPNEKNDYSENCGMGRRIPTDSYSVVLPTSSQDTHPSSLPGHQEPPVMPRVVNVVGASPDHSESTEESHSQPTDDYMLPKAYSCDICHKRFDSANSMMRHKRSHSGDRPYICKICGWGFNLSGNLNQHLAIHQKVKPFKCVYCGKTFARSNVLKAHVRCHTGERPYQCQLCGSKFIIGHNLKKHMLTRHGIKEDGPEEVGSHNGENQNESTSVPELSQPYA